ncbi:MAG: ABC transporter permease [Geminicoccaceae bacterium]|jgi:peptide/nickel transport system permease protein
MSFANVIRRRLLLLVLVVFGVSLITFVISHLMPGDPATLIAGERAPPEIVAHIREELGLDRPVPVQYGIYVQDLLHGDLGTSLHTNRPVAGDIITFLPATLELAVAALFFAILLGVPLGVLSAIHRDRPIDHATRIVSVAGISSPVFWIGLILILVFYGRLHWLPGAGRLDADLIPPPRLTGLYTVDALVAGEWAVLGSALLHLLLPAFTLGFAHLGIATRQVRSAMLEALGEDYVRTARANGLPQRRVIAHALRNALIPSVTLLGLAFGDLLYGAVLTETVFAWPGMGNYVVQAIQSLDFPAIMGFTVVVSAGYVLINLAVDLAYMFLDPQIRDIG